MENRKSISLNDWRVKAIQIYSDSDCGANVIKKRIHFAWQLSPSQQQAVPTANKNSSDCYVDWDLCADARFRVTWLLRLTHATRQNYLTHIPLWS